MISHTLNTLEDNTLEITLTIPWSDLQKEKEKAFNNLHKELAIKGFRKGKAPKTLAEKHIKEEDIYKKAFDTLLPQAYENVIKKEHIQPIIPPEVEFLENEKEKDWKVQIKTAQIPEVDVSEYKKIVENVKKDAKAQDIWVPGKEESKEKTQEKQTKKIETLIEALIKKIPLQLSHLIIEKDIKQYMAKLVDDIQKAGLSMDDYLKSKNTTIEKLKEQYKNELINMYKIELILQGIANKEKITVEQKEIDTFLEEIKDKQQKEKIKNNIYYYIPIMRKQKVLEYLNSL